MNNIDVFNKTNAELKDLFSDHMLSEELFDGLSYEAITKVISINPTVILYLKDPTPEQCGLAYSLNHWMMKSILKNKSISDDVIYHVLKIGDIGPFYDMHTYIDENLRNRIFVIYCKVKEELLVERYIEFCKVHNIKQNKDTRKMFNIMYCQKDSIMTGLISISDYYTYTIMKNVKFGEQRDVSNIYKQDFLLDEHISTVKKLILMYGDTRHKYMANV